LLGLLLLNRTPDSPASHPLPPEQDLLLTGGRLSEDDIARYSPMALAYVGDGVYELYVRRHYLHPPQRLRHYHQQVVAQVRAEQQAAHLSILLPRLTPLEADVVRRGRNAAPRRGRQGLTASLYQQATGFETLIGYLYLCDPARLLELLGQLELSPHV
jgi:ribonuclease-3 family protein